MCQRMGLRVLLLGCYLLLTIGGETRTTDKVPGQPLDGAARLDIHNGLATCGEDINPSLCDSYDISEECENAVVRRICNFSCSLSGQLWEAAWRGNLNIVKTAIAAGANPLCQKTIALKQATYYKRTSIHMAALANQQWVVKALLDAGVDANLQTTEVITPSWGSWGITPTYDASQTGSIDALNILIEHNANVNLPDSTGRTPLIAAAGKGQLSAAKALINANASIDVTGGSSNATALYWAAYYNRQDMALLLIELNANVNLPDLWGYTPLMRAASRDQLSLAKALINANASIDVVGGRWEEGTALYWAAMDNRQKTALLLLQSGADKMIPDTEGATPAAAARRWGNKELADLIESYTTSGSGTTTASETTDTS